MANPSHPLTLFEQAKALAAMARALVDANPQPPGHGPVVAGHQGSSAGNTTPGAGMWK